MKDGYKLIDMKTYDRKWAAEELERLSFELSVIGTELSQVIPLLKKSNYEELRAIELDCTGHSSAMWRIAVLSKPTKRKSAKRKVNK